jgi:prevent-host-death family protein
MVRVTEDEAKQRLGELLRDVAAGEETVLIEKDGEPQAIFISLNEYTRLREKAPQAGGGWQAHVDRVRERIAEELGGRPLPPAEDVIRRMREERDEQVLGSLR